MAINWDERPEGLENEPDNDDNTAPVLMPVEGLETISETNWFVENVWHPLKQKIFHRATGHFAYLHPERRKEIVEHYRKAAPPIYYPHLPKENEM